MYIEHGSNYFQKSIVRPLLECRNPNTISMGHTLGYYNFPSLDLSTIIAIILQIFQSHNYMKITKLQINGV